MKRLRSYVFIDRFQPQLAAAFAAESSGFLPVAGQSAFIVETEPGFLVNKAMDLALKSSSVLPGKSSMERHFGFLELHANSQDEVRNAGRTIINGLGIDPSEIIRPRLLSSEIVHRVTAHHAQMVNVVRKGSLLLAGTDFFTLECEPGGWVVLAANEVEKHCNITLVDCSEVGAVGRLSISGTTSQIEKAAETARLVLENCTVTL